MRRYTRNPEFTREWLSAAIAEFRKLYDRDSLPWMQQASFDKGSFASLLGVRVADGGRAIQVLSVGDSLAVLCDGDRIKATFPLSSAAEFTRSPQLICTNPTHNAFLDKMDLSYDLVADWSFRGLRAAGAVVHDRRARSLVVVAARSRFVLRSAFCAR